MTPRRDHPLTVNGLRLHVTEWGDVMARPVLMLHGIRGYAETFSRVAEALQPEFRVIAYDQRGRGRSDWDKARNYYTDAYVADLEEIRQALGLVRFDLLGHSMGGIVALAYAAAYPERINRLVIEDAGPGAFEESDGARRIRREIAQTPHDFNDWAQAEAFMRELRPSIGEAARQERLRSMLKPKPGGGFTWRYDLVGIAATRLDPDPARIVDLRQPVAQLACPTLVLRGGRSDYLSAEMAELMCALNPQVCCQQIEDAGHYIHDDQPEVFNQAARRFLLPSQ